MNSFDRIGRPFSYYETVLQDTTLETDDPRHQGTP